MASTEPEQHEAEAAPIPIVSTHNTVRCHLNSKKKINWFKQDPDFGDADSSVGDE
jgi:hypothetical protein